MRLPLSYTLKRYPLIGSFLILSVGAGLSIATVWGITGESMGANATSYQIAKGVISFLLALGIPVLLVVYALVTAVRIPTRIQGLAILLMSYLCLILAFASVYYAMTFLGDIRDANDQYYYYHYLAVMWPKNETLDPAFRQSSDRAFTGMQDRLWNGIEDRAQPYYYANDARAPVRKIMELADADYQFRNVARFNANARNAVFLDCLHYSIVTMATVGYGDMAPHSREAKIMTDMQIMSGQLLFVFALGVVFGKVGNRTKERSKKRVTRLT
jgi:hypothetical protein